MTIALAVLGVFVTYVPITGVSVSLDTIARATGASPSQLQWVSDGYIIPMAAAVLSAGVFGDLHGRRRVFSIGMVLTVLGAIIAGFASLLGDSAVFVLWGAQAVAGLGAGLLLPTTLALIAVAVPNPVERGKYIGFWATGIVVGLAVGPLFSGAILSFAGWGWIFVPSGVLAAAAGLFAHVKLPESKSPAGRHLDWPGQITATIAIAASIYGVIEGGAQGWGSLAAVVGLVIGGISLIAFVVVESRSTAPIMDLGLFRSVSFSAAGLAALVALFSVVGTMFLLSLFLGAVQHLDALGIGVRLLFVSGVATVVSPIVGMLLAKVKPILLLTAGLILNAGAVLLLTGVEDDTSLGQFAWRLAVFGVSLSLMLTSVSLVAINSAPWSQASMASAANTALRQTGGALGPAILGAVYISDIGSGAAPAAALHSALVVNLVLILVSAVVSVIAVVIPGKDPNAR
ncbi:MFS transporter [Curtobacterium sp. VKM Ac-1376]|nr:MFS transporter [Curtobacterium sp. VKM Ac-1376]